MRAKFEHREKEISVLINEMFEDKFLHRTLQFPENVTLDMSTLALLGHSMGAGTAIAASAKDSRIKACCPMDAWFFPYMDDLETILLKDTPLFHQRSET